MIARKRFISASLKARLIKGAFDMPMPCSPLSVPPSSTVALKISVIASCPRFTASGSFLSTITLVCTLPSPVCPKQGVVTLYFAEISAIFSSRAGSFERGTVMSSFIFSEP